MTLARVGPVVLATFLASLVECVEAMTIVLAVGTVRGWRPALAGAAAGTVVLAMLVVAFGRELARVPIHTLQLVIGALLLLFGMRWLRKAILRAAGLIGLHDEVAIYGREEAMLRREEETARGRGGLDGIAIATAFKAVMLEGLEVIFIVIAAGAGAMIVPAGLGAAAAALVVVLAGVALRRPLARVPENGLKFAVGVLLSSFGVFWLGEGLGFPWPGEDLALLSLMSALLAVAAIAVVMAKAVMKADSNRLASDSR